MEIVEIFLRGQEPFRRGSYFARNSGKNELPEEFSQERKLVVKTGKIFSKKFEKPIDKQKETSYNIDRSNERVDSEVSKKKQSKAKAVEAGSRRAADAVQAKTVGREGAADVGKRQKDWPEKARMLPKRAFRKNLERRATQNC